MVGVSLYAIVSNINDMFHFHYTNAGFYYSKVKFSGEWSKSLAR